ncbi:hypothetical protein ScPMuIL_008248 [Solemya velum]
MVAHPICDAAIRHYKWRGSKYFRRMMVPLFILGVLICGVTDVYSIPTRPPGIFLQPAFDVYFKIKETVQLPCVADGNPIPQYNWKKDGVDFNPSGNDHRMVQLANAGTIVINDPEDKDEGIYQCFAENDYGISVTININFRQAKLASFPVLNDQTYRPQLGAHLTLNCVPPTSYPTADVYWVYQNPTGAFMPINYDKRVTMDQEHRLRITNVVSDDSKINGDLAYVCIAMNYFMRLNRQSHRHYIRPSGTTEEKRPVSYLWATPSDHFGLLGEDLRLKCIFAGNPTPNVFWRRNNGTLPERSKTGSFTQELLIQDLRFSDAGEYECWGTNSETASQVSRTFTMRVESHPYWIEEPRDIETSIGAKATFLCRAGGIPTPRIYWFINGVPMNDVTDRRIISNRFLKPNEYNITLVNLTRDDAMVIQCNATNKHGYIFSDVYLNVLSEAPSILRPPELIKKSAEGQAVSLTCETSGKPDPIITWFKNDYQITGGRYKTLPNGDLHIEKLVLADAGDFRCEAENIYGRMVAGGKLIVRRKTQIEAAPLDLEVNANIDAKFICSGTTDYEEVENLSVFWKKDGKIITTNDQRMTQNHQDNSLTISGTISRDSGTYTCVVSNGLDNATASAILTVKDRPDPPIDVVVKECSQHKAEITWTKGSDNSAPIQYFIVQYNTTFAKDQWVFDQSTVGIQTTATVNLSPWASYTFRVIAKNKIGESEPSFPTPTACTTQSARPDSHPHDVRSIGNKRGYLIIEWTPMSQIQQNGQGFQYTVLQNRKGDQESTSPITIDKWNETHLEINVGSSEAYMAYEVYVKASNNHGESSAQAQKYILHSGEDIPQVVINDFSVDYARVFDNTATFTWSWDMQTSNETAMKGEFQGFKIQFWRGDNKLGTFREIDVLKQDLELVPDGVFTGRRKKRSLERYEKTIGNLLPFTRYEAQIRVMNTFYVGAASVAVSLETLEGVPGPIRSLVATVKGSNHFVLKWERPDEADMRGRIVGYDITYQTVEGLELGKMQDRDPQLDDPYESRIILSGLLPSTKYRVHVYGRTLHGRGEDSFLELETTAPGPPDAPVFSIERVGGNFVNITWSQSLEPGERAGTVYYVEYRKLGASDWQQTTEEAVYNYKNVTNLESGITYEMRVVTTNGEDTSPSGIQEVTTTGVASAISLVGNIGWFLGMLFAVIAVIIIGGLIWFLRKRRKDIPDKPRYRAPPQSKQAIQPREPEPRGHYNDYFKERDSVDDAGAKVPEKKGYQADSYYRDYYDKDYNDEKGDEKGYESYDHREKDYDKRDSYRDSYYGSDKAKDDYDDRDYDRRYDDQDYDRHYENQDDDRDYDRRYDDRDYDGRYDDRDYDRRYDDEYDNRRDDDYQDRKPDNRDRYDDDRDYRRDYDEKQYHEDDRSPDKRPPSDAYEEYQREPSKFDSSGEPIKFMPGNAPPPPPPPPPSGGGAGMGAMSTFV